MGATVELNVGDLLARAWEVFKSNAGAFLGAALVCLLIYGLTHLVLSQVHQTLATLGMILIGGPLQLGLNKMALAGARGQRVNFATLFDGFNNPANAILANLLISVFTMIGFACVVVPGVLIYTLYCTTFLFMVDGTTDFWGAMENSRKFTSENYLQWLLVAVVAIVLMAAGLALCAVGAVVTAPLAMLLIAFAYERQRTSGRLPEEPVVLP